MRPEAPGPGGEVVVYEAAGGEVGVEVRLERETVWLTQKQMAVLFDTSSDNVGLHLKNIFSEGELAEAATAEDYSVVQTEGRRRVRRQVKHYSRVALSKDSMTSSRQLLQNVQRFDPRGSVWSDRDLQNDLVEQQLGSRDATLADRGTRQKTPRSSCSSGSSSAARSGCAGSTGGAKSLLCYASTGGQRHDAARAGARIAFDGRPPSGYPPESAFCAIPPRAMLTHPDSDWRPV